MAKGAAKGLCTIARTRKELANGDLPSDGLGGVVNFYHVIIFVDPYYWANSPWARKLVEQAIAEDMVGNCTSLDVQNILYHVMSIQELETFLPTLKETGLAALIKTKETTENDYHSDFRGFFSKHLGSNLNNEMLSSVLDNFINEHGPHNDGGN